MGQLISTFYPGRVWNDTAGNAVQAHGGGILWDEPTQKYYWYGEQKQEPNLSGSSVQSIGVAVYSSTDLYNWVNEGLALPVFNNPEFFLADPHITDDTPMYLRESAPEYRSALAEAEQNLRAKYNTLELLASGEAIEKLNDLYSGVPAEEKKRLFRSLNWNRVIERPKVVYNRKDRRYVMWFHSDGPDYRSYLEAQAGVAVSDSPTGPFRYLGSSRPNGLMSRDMTLFQDEDGTAYLILAAEDNKVLAIEKLSNDYTAVTGEYTKNYTDSREAPAMFRHDGRYYLITSGCTGWRPNTAEVSSADNPMGPFRKEDRKNPCVGADADLTFYGQSTFVLPLHDKKDRFIFLADKWNPSRLSDSRYLWLPLQVDGTGEITITWFSRWNLGQLDALNDGRRDKLDTALKRARDLGTDGKPTDRQRIAGLLAKAFELAPDAEKETCDRLADEILALL